MLCLVAALGCARAGAQSVTWTTNFYSVTGSNFREIRQSITESRPWKDSYDGDTKWRIQWSYQLNQTSGGCTCNSLITRTTITTTMPRWTPPADVLPEVKEQWTRYFTNLLQHEVGHARIGMAAATEIRRQIAQLAPADDCETLKKSIDEKARRIVDAHHAQDGIYDEQTNHGRPRDEPPFRVLPPNPRQY
jgi:predicted secreted Zn-dependent protease